YIVARKRAANPVFVFGTWKIEILGAYSSALILGIAGILMVFTSVERLLNPLMIHYNQALFVAAIGFVVDLVCAAILHRGPHLHSAAHGHDHDHSHGHDDLNFKSAYLHVIADAMTSVFAIVALLGAKYFSWNWLDPVMGMVGAAMVGRWAFLLLRDSSKILLDREKCTPLSVEIRNRIESDGDSRIHDLHLWRVSDSKYACIISLVTGREYTIDDYRKRLLGVHELAHTTIEINPCGSGLLCGHTGHDSHEHPHPHGHD
ncbi:MAG TPA: cation transporter, partial [Candidatus Omnitrophica bacterium]|nr:cation transporter [Candidatus Omnitrophota bacterium]